MVARTQKHTYNFSRIWRRSAEFCLLLFIFPIGELRADFHCEGPHCSYLRPAHVRFFADFENRYLDVLSQDMILAQAYTNLASMPGSTVLVDKFNVGVRFSVGSTALKNVPLIYVDGSPRLFPERGFALNTGFVVGINTGWAIAALYDQINEWKCELKSGKKKENCSDKHLRLPFLDSLDLYVLANKSGMGQDFTFEKNDRLRAEGANLESAGAAVRFHLLERRRIFSSLVEFSGMSMGLGLHSSGQYGYFSIHKEPSWSGPGSALIPDLRLIFAVDSVVESTMFDIRFGFDIFRFIHLAAGAGISRHRGNSTVELDFYGSEFYDLSGAATVLQADMVARHRSNFDIKYAVATVGIGDLYFQGTFPVGDKKSVQNEGAISVLLILRY